MRDVLIVLLIALIIVVGGWKFWSYQQNLNGDGLTQDSLLDESLSEGDLVSEESDTEDGPSVKLGQPVASSSEANIIKIISPATDAPSQDILTADSGLKVDDQKAGSKAEVKQAVLTKAGWVAIRDYKDGKMGNTLGAKLLAPGTATSVFVELLRPMIAGSSYVAIILIDSGDGSYKGADDLPFTDPAGKTVMKVFKAN